MGKIYSGIDGVAIPEYQSGEDFRAYLARENKYVEDVKAWAKENGSGPEAGEEIDFPQGDGQARYVVVSLKPVKLVHLSVGDKWSYPYINRLTADDLRKEVGRARGLRELFNKAKARAA